MPWATRKTRCRHRSFHCCTPAELTFPMLLSVDVCAVLLDRGHDFVVPGTWGQDAGLIHKALPGVHHPREHQHRNSGGQVNFLEEDGQRLSAELHGARLEQVSPTSLPPAESVGEGKLCRFPGSTSGPIRLGRRPTLLRAYPQIGPPERELRLERLRSTGFRWPALVPLCSRLAASDPGC